MSQKLKRSKSFLTLLLDTKLPQARALLNTVTDLQVEAVVEFVYNLMNIASLSKDRAALKQKAFLKKLVNKRTKLNQKKRLVIKHRVQLLKTLVHFKKALLNILK